MTADRRPYVDRPITDRDAAIAAAAWHAAAWGLPEPTVLRHGMNTLLACDDVVLRIGVATAPAERAHAAARWLLAAGVPTVEPIDGLAADADGVAITGWRRFEPVDAPADWESIGRAVRLVHSLPVADVPAGYPVPDPATFPWWDFESMLAETVDEIDAAAFAGLRATVDRATGWPRRLGADAVLCHGDVHPGNVLVTDSGALLIDWDLMCVANPAWDFAFLTTYAKRWGGDDDVLRRFEHGYGGAYDRRLAADLGELRNVAATLMRVKAARTDPAAAAEAERRLRYWRGDPDAPVWRAQ